MEVTTDELLIQPLRTNEAEISDGGRTLRIHASDGAHYEIPAVWLRDQCSCSTCRHPSGQRLFEVADLPLDTRLESAHVDGDQVQLEFSTDGHRGQTFISEIVLRENARPRTVTTWDAESADLAWHDFDAVIDDPSELFSFLADCDEFGFSLLRGVPADEGMVTRIVDLFGFVRVTNYGELFNVRTVVDPTNLANTSLALGGHSDNPYRTPVPTPQLLHCLTSSVAGGVSTLVDGFRVADELRQFDRASFDVLTDTPLRFRYADESVDLETWAPVIECDVRGSMSTVRFNTRSALPSPTPAEQVSEWYLAYATFARLIREPRFIVDVSLQPGDLILFDNRRVLHGRSGYDPRAGARHLQGCYADVDSLRSRIAVLERNVVQRA
jgi:gamma-butyrobetaine dioxygenase